VMRYQQNLSMTFFDRVGQRGEPRLDLRQGYEVIGLINDDGAPLGDDKVQNYIQAN
jgi:hypothetical protein